MLPELERLRDALHEDLGLMARPVLALADPAQAVQPARIQHWLDTLAALQGVRLDAMQLRSLTHGQRQGGPGDDSLHLLVMDLHKAINQLVPQVASELIAGAHVWQLDEADRPWCRPSCVACAARPRSSSTTRAWRRRPPATAPTCCCRTTSAPTTPMCW